MTRRILAIAFIFCAATAAWMILGANISSRTRQADAQLRGRVGSIWGSSQTQRAPTAFIERLEIRGVGAAAPLADRQAPASRSTAAAAPGAAAQTLATETVRVRVPLALDQTRAEVDFDLDHRRKGLLWYSTYAVRFDGSFVFRNVTTTDSVFFEFPLPATQAVYDDLRVAIDGVESPYEIRGNAVVTSGRLAPGTSAMLSVSYRSQGLDFWRYTLGNDVSEVRDFRLEMTTNFEDIDFPDNTLAPGEKTRGANGWKLAWNYQRLLSGFQIGMSMPRKLQPGPIAGEIAFFAPVSLLFFFAAMFIIVTIRRIDLHPMNYAFLAAAFFAFHLLLAYLVDHISIHLAFAIASVVSIGLVTSYMRIVIGPRFAFREAALAQLIYLVLFSYVFFFEGITGLAITIGSVITLFIAMQLTGRIDWTEAFTAPPQRDGRVPPT